MEVVNPANAIRIRVESAVRLYAVAAAFAMAGWLLTQSIRLASGHETQKGLVALFDLNGEANVPTWVSTIAILGAAVVAALNAAAERRVDVRVARAWSVLAAGLAYLSLDEAVSLHEQLSHALHAAGGGAASYTVLQLALMSTLAVAGAALCGPLLAALPVRTRAGLVGAGALYVFGAAGVDALGGLWVDGDGAQRKLGLVHLALTTLEEASEIAGMILFVHVAGAHLERRHGPLAFAGAQPD